MHTGKNPYSCHDVFVHLLVRRKSRKLRKYDLDKLQKSGWKIMAKWEEVLSRLP